MPNYEIVKEFFRGDGYYCVQVKCVIADEIHMIECVYGTRKPSDAFRTREIERRILKFEDEINDPIETSELYTEEGITAILIEKGYLNPGERFSQNMIAKEKVVVK